MPTPNIHFFEEDIHYILKHKTKLRQWILNTIIEEKKLLTELNFIFCSDNYLLNVNQTYLNHNTFTDIITFDNSENHTQLLGDIFISIERVRENAKIYQVAFFDELCRVLIHGTLHLLGYKDKTKTEKMLMTEKEDFYLQKRLF